MALTPAERARIEAQIATKEQQLETANTTLSSLLSVDHESYKFDSNEGAQQVKRLKMLDLKEIIDSLESEIENLNRKLRGGGIVNINVRRKASSY